MSFRIRKAGDNPSTNIGSNPVSFTGPTLQEKIESIEAKYERKDTALRNSIKIPANPVLEEYRRNLIKTHAFENDTIVFDTFTGKYKIVNRTEDEKGG